MGLKTLGPRLPKEYQEVAYIQGSNYVGRSTYIDTGVVPNNSISVEGEFSISDTSAYENYICGCYGASSDNFTYSYKSYKCNYGFGGETKTMSRTVNTNKHTMKIEADPTNNSAKFYLDGVNFWTANSPAFTGIGRIILFGRYITSSGDKNNSSSVYLYKFKMWNGNTLIRDFVPCYRKSDNIPGLWDLVTKEFYAGNAQFSKGYNNVNYIPRNVRELRMPIPSLPSIYQEVEWIKGNGTGGYINTGLTSSATLECELDFSFDVIPTEYKAIVIGVGNNNGNYRIIYKNGKMGLGYGTGWTSKSLSLDTNRHKLKMKNGPNGAGIIYISMDGSEVWNYNCGSSEYYWSDHPTVYLLAEIQGTTKSYVADAKIYAAKFWKDGSIVRIFIPCYRKSDGVIGLYDSVNNVFYTKQGTGVAFTKGPDVTESQYNTPKYVGELYKSDGQGGVEHIFSAGWDKTLTSQNGSLTTAIARAKPLNTFAIKGKCKQKEVPDEYTQLEYLENTSQAYIMTGLYPGDTKLSAEVKFQASASAVSSSLYPCIFSCFTNEGTGSGSDVYNFGIYNNKWRYKLITNQGYGANADTSIHTIHWNKDDGTRLDNDTAWVASRVTIPSSNNKELPLFARNTNGVVSDASFVGKIYYAKFWNDSNVLVRNFIPVKRNSDDVLGMYDTVTDTFFTNAGTDTFTAGSIMPSPTNPIEVKGVGDSRLPNEYQEVEYLESDGADTKYIDTGIKPYEINKWVLNAQFTNITTLSPFKGNGSFPVDNNRFDIGYSANNKFWLAIGLSATTITSDTNKHTFILDKEHNKGYVDDTELTYTQVSWSTSSNLSICLFNRTYYGTGNLTFGCPVKIYNSVMYDTSNQLVRNMIPCYRKSDSAAGMYDLVNDVFYPNAGTGTFIVGPDAVKYVVPFKINNVINNIDISRPLYKVGTYIDILSPGLLTKNVGAKVLDGTESWVYHDLLEFFYLEDFLTDITDINTESYCSHYIYNSNVLNLSNGEFHAGTNTNRKKLVFKDTRYSDATAFKAWLAAQYAAGAPVIVYYALATSVTEVVSAPALSTVHGVNTMKIDTEVIPSEISVNYRAKYEN